MRYVGVLSVGGLIPDDTLDQIAQEVVEGQKASSFGLPASRRLSDELSRAWSEAQNHWTNFKLRRDDLGKDDPYGTTLTRRRWVTRLLEDCLDFELFPVTSGPVINGRTYPISHRAGENDDAPAVHIEGFRINLDERQESRRLSPHALVQQYLNVREGQLWGLVTNGLELRLLRQATRASKPSYIEFDLENILEENRFNEFTLLYRLCHRTRLPKGAEDAPSCLLEKYFQVAIEQGGRIRDHLRDAVEKALVKLGTGFLQHPENAALVERVRSGAVRPADYHRQLLRLVYRLLFLMVAEERHMILPEEPESDRRWKLYDEYYSVSRLRRLCERYIEKIDYSDLWEGLKKTFLLFENGSGGNPLGIPPLNGDLFGPMAMCELATTRLKNTDLLEAMQHMSLAEQKGGGKRKINYSGLDVEELGSVYESLLDFQPVFVADEGGHRFELRVGSERKSTGSYYTRPELVRELIESALVPAMEDRLKRVKEKDAQQEQAKKEQAILSMTVCDPACGSGHFLLAAARRLGRELAKVRTGEDEPTPREFHLAVRDVIAHCIYAVDLNPLAVDLCKLALWLEGHWTGKPLSFLDHRIKCGNSLIGVLDPKVLEEGIPDEAYTPVTCDVKAVASAYKRENKEGRKRLERSRNQGRLRFNVGDHLHALAHGAREISAVAEETPADVRQKAQQYAALHSSGDFNQELLASHLWSAAFFAEMKEHDDNRVPTTEELERCLENLPVNGNTLSSTFDLAQKIRFFHWRLEFPEVFENGGFDVMLGNPPWERVKLQEEEYWATDPYISAAKNKAERLSRIAQYRESEDTNLRNKVRKFEGAKRQLDAQAKFIRNSGRCILTATGDINTFAVFTESALTLLGQHGRVGIIVPSAIATGDMTSRFFARLVNERLLVSMKDFQEARDFFQGLESRDPFCLLTLRGSSAPRNEPFAFVFQVLSTSELSNLKRRVLLNVEDFALLNPNTGNCPIFRTSVDAEVTKKVYRRVPVLVDERNSRNSWAVEFKAMFHMANDSRLFTTACSADASGLPLFEAKMIHQFDHRWQTFDHGKSRNVTEQEKADPQFRVQPRYWVPRAEVKSRTSLDDSGWFIALRRFARANDERTIIATLLPLVGAGDNIVAIHSPIFRQRNKGFCLLANLNCLVLDYIARQKLGSANVNFFVLKQLPVIPPDSYSEADRVFITRQVATLVFNANDLACLKNVFGTVDPVIWDSAARLSLGAELDAYFAHLYGLTRDELRYILDPKDVFGDDFPSETFRVLKEREEREFGEYRTRRLVLEAFDKLAEWPRFCDEVPKRVSAFEAPKQATSAGAGRR